MTFHIKKTFFLTSRAIWLFIFFLVLSFFLKEFYFLAGFFSLAAELFWIKGSVASLAAGTKCLRSNESGIKSILFAIGSFCALAIAINILLWLCNARKSSWNSFYLELRVNSSIMFTRIILINNLKNLFMPWPQHESQ